MNKRLQTAAWAAGMLTALLALPSCGDGGAGGITHEYLERTVMIGAVPLVDGELTKGSWESLEGAAPLTIAAGMSYGAGWNDVGRASDFMSRIEVDFGDGTGWTDLTSEMLTLFAEEGKSEKSIPPEAVSHTYTTPGEYEMRARITYKDGEVVYSDAPGRQAGEVGDVVLIRVLLEAATL